MNLIIFLLRFLVALMSLAVWTAESWIVTNRYCVRWQNNRQRVSTTASFPSKYRQQHVIGHSPYFQQSTTASHRRELSNQLREEGTSSRRSILGVRQLAIATFMLLVFVFVGPRIAMASLGESHGIATAVAAAGTSEALVASAPTVTGVSATTTTTAVTNAFLTAPINKVDAFRTGSVISLANEVRLCVRLLFAALAGGLVGWERSSSKHAAGVRTLSLVSLAAASYTICSAYGFSAFARVDPARMASNVASGVGFLGAGVITTSTIQQHQRQQHSNDDTTATTSSDHKSPPNTVHGLTTAAAIWLSAAIGVACGVGLFFVASTATLTTIAILRFGRVKPATLSKRPPSGGQVRKPKSQATTSSGGRDTRVEPNQQQQQLFDLPGITSKAISTTTTTPDIRTPIAAPDYIDEEIELLVRSAIQNATDNSSIFKLPDLSGFVAPLMKTSSNGPQSNASP